MSCPTTLIESYIQAKDCNRPWLMPEVFESDASLEMVVKSDAISFPSAVSGVENITETLVRQFSQDNENVYTFCLCDAPRGDLRQFTCDWLVGMSKRETGEVRVGCGQYHWDFGDAPKRQVRHLKIVIEAMQVMNRDMLDTVMRWLSGLDYPWCAVSTAILDIPRLEGLAPVAGFLEKRKAEYDGR